MSLISLLVILLFPLWALMVHIIVCRLPLINKLPKQLMVLPVGLITIFMTLIVLINLEGRDISPGCFLFALFSCLGLFLVYFHVFNMSETARRIRLLLELKQHRRLGLERPLNYAPAEGVRIRLGRLVALKQIKKEGDFYSARFSPLLLVALVVKGYEDLFFSAQKRRS